MAGHAKFIRGLNSEKAVAFVKNIALNIFLFKRVD